MLCHGWRGTLRGRRGPTVWFGTIKSKIVGALLPAHSLRTAHHHQDQPLDMGMGKKVSSGLRRINDNPCLIKVSWATGGNEHNQTMYLVLM